MARSVRPHAIIPNVAADIKLDAVQWMMLLSPVIELAMPTSPAMSENRTKNPVAMFPIGKCSGNRRTGICKVAAAKQNETETSRSCLFNQTSYSAPLVYVSSLGMYPFMRG
ncbi:hypothetical protein ACLOJK_025914 [Asimina triloba]